MDLVQGTLDYLILRTLTQGEAMHGFAILEWIHDTSDGALTLEEGSLYPALHRMERKRWIGSSWGISDKGRRAKFYRIRPSGQRQLIREESRWDDYVGVVAKIRDASE